MSIRLARLGAGLVFAALATAHPAGSAETVDTREAVLRTEAERAFILEQMRLFLTTLAAIDEDLAAGDVAKAGADAALRGRKANPRPAALGQKESEAWKGMMGNVRGGFDEIAAAAGSGATTQQLL
eukprot:gene23348-24768_t